MAKVFQVEKLADMDQQHLKRGLCPWCLCRTVPLDDKDVCPECGDEFVGKLTISD